MLTKWRGVTTIKSMLKVLSRSRRFPAEMSVLSFLKRTGHIRNP